MAIQNSNLPPFFVNEVVKIVEDVTIVRSNLESVSDVYSWIEEYGRTSDTKWNFRSSKPSGTRLVCCVLRTINKIHVSHCRCDVQKSDVRFTCPIKALQSYNGALLEYRMPICIRAFKGNCQKTAHAPDSPCYGAGFCIQQGMS
ncbi:hypothetical protein AVEN_68590-1 [Araneus ventricosus]|uniref:Uncharacterized protein n=1 Tax=Araneus ventricosus TaxID=182803 RepID=A0A4Y2FA58_ARAVE|nr:hypothetical protein AVEN_68590-1 [Araneus ventricosus]